MKSAIKKVIITLIIVSMAFSFLMIGAVASAVSTIVVGNASEQESLPDDSLIEDGGEYNGGQFAWPVPGVTYVSSDYGWRACPYHGREFHSGIDIAGSAGKAIVAAESGTVALAGWNGGYGKCVIISHGSGLYSLYGHMLSFNVKTGQKVTKGKHIGYVGSTGNSTGPHLHFEVRKGSSLYAPHTSPWNYLKK